MKKNFIYIILVSIVFIVEGCSKSQVTSNDINYTEQASQDILSQNISALKFIKESILNNGFNLTNEEQIAHLANSIDHKVKLQFPLAFSYPSITKTKANDIDAIYSLIDREYMNAFRETILFDIEKFQEKREQYFQSESFNRLSLLYQNDVRNFLITIEACRNIVVETAMEIINNSVTKSSGAEMRAWSEMGQQMSEEDYGKIVDGFIYMVAGVAGMASVPAGLVIGAVGLIVSWCR